LQRHVKELLKSSDKRADKWKIWCDMFTEHSAHGREEELVTEFLNYDAIHASLLSICGRTPNDGEDLLLLQIFSFLLLESVKPENIMEFVTIMSACTEENGELTKLVVNSVQHLETLAPSASGTDTLAIFPSFFASLELYEKAQQCNKIKSSSTTLHTTEQVVHKLVQDHSTEHAKSEGELAEKSNMADEKISKLDSEIEELRSKLAHQANEIQTTTSALNAKKVQKKAKEDKLGLVRTERADCLKIRAVEENKMEATLELSRAKIEVYKKNVSSLTTLDKNLRETLAKLVAQFIVTLNSLISGQETNIQYLDTKFTNYHSSMNEFRSEPEIFAKLHAAFAQCARNFRILTHNTQVLAQSAEVLAHILGAREWDAARAQVNDAQDRVAALKEREREMDKQFGISNGGA